MFLCTSRGTKKIGGKLKNENRVPSILGLRLKVTVILLIWPYLGLGEKKKKKNRVPSILGLRLKVTVFLLIFAYLLKLLFYYL